MPVALDWNDFHEKARWASICAGNPNTFCIPYPFSKWKKLREKIENLAARPRCQRGKKREKMENPWKKEGKEGK